MRLGPRPKEVVGVVYLAHIEYGVVEVPCVRLGEREATATHHSAMTGYTTRLTMGVACSEGAARGFFMSKESAEKALGELLLAREEWARAKAISAARESNLAAARLLRLKSEGPRHSVHGPGGPSMLYPPGPSAETDEGEEERRREAELLAIEEAEAAKKARGE